MAFIPKTVENGGIPEVIKLPCSAITPKVGMLLYMTSGKLAIASGANLAQYVSMEEHSAAVTAGTEISVIRIIPSVIFETTKDSTNAMTVGVAYDVASGGLQVDDNGTTTANFLCESVEGTAAGSAVTGRFVK